MAQALGVPAYGVCSLDAIGAAAGPGRVLVATDARRREVYWARYVDGVRQDGPAVAKPADVTVEADRALGAGAAAYAEVLGLPVADEPRYPVGTALVGLAAERILAGAPGEVLEPRYLRRPDVTLSAAAKPTLPEAAGTPR
jgi:tRNA threonylcarbamoyl adenosine modification protein YeaZ